MSGINFPYRGIETHGVAATAMPEQEFDPKPSDYVLQYPEKDTKEPAATPVRVVEMPSGDKEIQRLKIIRTVVSTDPIVIVASNQSRSGPATIKNLSATTAIFISSEPGQANALLGWEIPFGTSLTLETDEKVYATSAAGLVNVAIMETVVVPG